ncbi:MAG: AzlD domain-containing protein [Treponema sp.]|nr:AzlD domain-containing protein [Treponema sp.]
MRGNIYIYIFVAFAVSYLIRVLPLTLIRKPIRNLFIRSFLYYVPYVTLSVMTFPAIIYATDSTFAGLAALAGGVILAFMGVGLFPVASACCIIAFAAEHAVHFFN